jgi:hypothetical protein
MPNTRNLVATIQRYHPEVTKVVDAKKNITIKVTDEDCRGSTSKAPNECAMATAFKRTYDGAIISVASAYLVKGKTAYRYKVPITVAREIVTFDRHHDFAPGEYRLTAPRGTQRLGQVIFPRPITSHTGRVKQRQHRTSGIRQL